MVNKTKQPPFSGQIGDFATEVTFCRGRRCCPTIKVNGDNITIGEDSNIVVLSRSQFFDLHAKLNETNILREMGLVE